MNRAPRTKKGKSTNLLLTRHLRSAMTPAESRLWSHLRSKQFHAFKFRRQHGIGPFIVEFFCPQQRLVVEVDGDVHAEPINLKREAEREEYLRSLGLLIVRYTNDEVLNNLEGVIENLLGIISKDSTSPSPSLQRRGNQKLHLTLKDHAKHRFNHSPNPLSRSFFDRPTLTVAKALLGKVLIRDLGHSLLTTRIVDVEAYIGKNDLACHASKGRTKRTEVMFGPAGFTYIYLIYGMYDLLNIVTEGIDFPAAILIRGIDVLDHENLKTPTRIHGPGRVTRFLQVNRDLNKWDTTNGQTLWIEDGGSRISRQSIQTAPRIGVEYAGEWAKKLWRFYLPPPNQPKRLGHVV
ncbi:MAG: DNA-3-methyladenine glycosylase [Nitrospirota bacterium]|nr:DNA-3-methyladenine glycosylase [Nitrospirota bacterium]